ncbi:MAP kinase kinase kinase [Aureococcus anophagefferens]|nr:MAP kinase kinase kinase [Aureococcus anophagefferens]
MAPEIMANAPYAPAADVWSFGGVVLQMATGHFPWLEVKRTSTADLFAYVTTHNVAPACPTHFSAELHDFLGAIFDRDADRRPAAAALLRHAFLEEPDDADELNSSFTEQEKGDSTSLQPKKAPGAIRVDGADEAKRAEPSPYGRSSASDAASVATTPDALGATLKARRGRQGRPRRLAPSTPSTLATPSPVDDGSSRRAVFKMPAWRRRRPRRTGTTRCASRRASPARPRTAPPVPYRGDDAAAPPAQTPPPAEPPAAARPPPATGTAAAGSAVGALYFARSQEQVEAARFEEAPTSSRSLGDARPADPGAPPPSSRSLDGH